MTNTCVMGCSERASVSTAEEETSRACIILVVEDDDDLRRAFRLALTLSGFDVEEACDGHEALVRLELRPPDLVVLDLGLPAVSGEAVRQEIAAQAYTRDIPIVVVTGSSEDLSRLDVPCVLRKPVVPDEVVAAVRSCLRSESPHISL